MSHKKHEVPGIISIDVDEERRLCKCAKKYETIVKQFDELKGMMTKSIMAVPKGRKRPRGNGSAANTASSSHQPESNEALLQTVTRFLHEL